jgi:hypothetical protein
MIFPYGWRQEFDFIKTSFKFKFDKELFMRRIHFWKQKLTRGFSDDELWDLKGLVAKIMLPRLKRFIKTDPAVRSPDEKAAFQEIIWFLEKQLDDSWHMSEQDILRYKKAAKLFGRYFGHLWQ